MKEGNFVVHPFYFVLPPISPKRGTFDPASFESKFFKVHIFRVCKARLLSLFWGRVGDRAVELNIINPNTH